MNQDHKKKVTIEGLMRFKRMEQPAPEFWRSFDKELRAKQLAAIVEKRPWWSSLVSPFTYVRRHPAMLGAAAALTISLVSYKYIHFFGIQGHGLNTAQSQAIAELAADTTKTSHQENVQAIEIAHPQASSIAQVGYKTSKTVAEVQDKRFQSTGFRTEFSDIDSPSARSIAANLAAARASQPEMISHLLGLESHLVSVTNADYTSEPLERVASPSEERRARLLATSLPSASHADARLGSSGIERTLSSLSEDRLYQSIRRYDVGGENISMKVKF
jgi:hypothetical protein